MRDMMRGIATIAITFAAWNCSATQATESPTSSDGSHISQILKVLSDGQARTFDKSVDFCDRLEPTDQKAIKGAFDKYLINFQAGTRLGLLEISKTEPITSPPPELMQGPIVDVQVKQSDMLVKAAQTNPSVVCGRLLSRFTASTAEEFQKDIEANYRQYQQRRRELCSKGDRPQNCTQEIPAIK